MNSQEIIQIIKLFQIDVLISFLILYYAYKIMNMVVILIGNVIRFIQEHIWKKDFE